MNMLEHHRYRYLYLLLFCAALTPCLVSGCRNDKPREEASAFADAIAVDWELIRNSVTEDGGRRFLSAFTFENGGEAPLAGGDWSIYFNFRHDIIPESVSDGTQITFINGDFYRLSPDTSFSLPPGERVSVRFEGRGNLIKDDRAPSGLYVVYTGNDGTETDTASVVNYTAHPLTTARVAAALEAVPDAGSRYAGNEDLHPVDSGELLPVLPTPRTIRFTGGSIVLDGEYRIYNGEGLDREARYLAEALERYTGMAYPVSPSGEAGPGIITLDREGAGTDSDDSAPEGYRLEVSNDRSIAITGNSAAGVFYGIQTLLHMIPPETLRQPSQQRDVTLKTVTVDDAPRFPYRGMHLDVSRNFNGKEAVFKLLDLMAFYKLNKFHFHLTDDEGWRLEIEELPELTEVGAFRGHTLDDANHLQPAYGSGPYPDPSQSFGSGFFTRGEYKEIIRYADDRHIEVIPEFDVPGHARAAIKAMEARHARLMEEGRVAEADEYRLIDPDDASEYSSAQDFNDNVISVCRESVYHFFETVVDDVLEMHREAGVPLHTIHMGGDEVPEGAWEQSPLCDRFIRTNSDVEGVGDLPGYFVERLARMFARHGLTLAGWQEIAAGGHGGSDAHGGITPPSAGQQVTIYSWDNFTGGNRDLGYRVANAGYPVVLCNATNLYFELAYSRDPAEPGDYFGGFIDTRRAFEFMPMGFTAPMHEAATQPSGTPMVQLRNDVRENIRGIQAHLWSEPIKGPDSLEYFYAPKILGLAERAWAPRPAWAALEERSGRRQAYNEAWNRFAHTLGRRELPRLDYLFGGYNYRLPLPGAVVTDGMLHANVAYPGLDIRYSTDGTVPSNQSELYTGPVAVEGEVLLRTFNTRGRGSRVTPVRQ